MNKTMCDNVDCENENDDCLYEIILRSEFNGEKCHWCKACICRDEDMIEYMIGEVEPKL